MYYVTVADTVASIITQVCLESDAYTAFRYSEGNYYDG